MPDGRYGKLSLKDSHALLLMECMAILLEQAVERDSAAGCSWGLDGNGLGKHPSGQGTGKGIKQMTVFLAEQIALQGKNDEIRQMRSLVEALNLYWGADGKEDCTGEFDEKIQQAR